MPPQPSNPSLRCTTPLPRSRSERVVFGMTTSLVKSGCMRASRHAILRPAHIHTLLLYPWHTRSGDELWSCDCCGSAGDSSGHADTTRCRVQRSSPLRVDCPRASGAVQARSTRAAWRRGLLRPRRRLRPHPLLRGRIRSRIATTVSVTSATKTNPSACEILSSGIPCPPMAKSYRRRLKKRTPSQAEFDRSLSANCDLIIGDIGRFSVCRDARNGHARRPTISKMPPICGSWCSRALPSRPDVCNSAICGSQSPCRTRICDRCSAAFMAPPATSSPISAASRRWRMKSTPRPLKADRQSPRGTWTAVSSGPAS